MNRTLAAAVAAGLVSLAAPSAVAAPGYTITGGCFLHVSNQSALTNGAYVGTIGDRSVTTTTDTPPATVSATVSCEVRVNGVTLPTSGHSYSDVAPGTQAGADQIAFVAGPSDVIQLCQRTDYAGGVASDPWTCADYSDAPGEPSTDVETVYCDALNTTSSGTFTPPLATAAGPHTDTLSVSTNCTNGAGDDVGTYDLTLTMTTNESCTSGSGSGNVTGSGPEGALSQGTISFTRPGPHYYMDGSFTSGGEQHTLRLWLDLEADLTAPPTCPIASSQILGHGAVTDEPGSPTDLDIVYCDYASVNGSATFTPPLDVMLGSHTDTISVRADCTNGVGDDLGRYAFTLSLHTSESCAGGTGDGTVTGEGPEGTISGSASFYRPGVHFYVNGSFASGGEQHTLQLWLDMLPALPCPVASSDIIGHGAVVDA